MTLYVALLNRIQNMPVGQLIRYRGNRVLRLQASTYLLNGETTDPVRIARRLADIRDAIDGRIRERDWLRTLEV